MTYSGYCRKCKVSFRDYGKLSMIGFWIWHKHLIFSIFRSHAIIVNDGKLQKALEVKKQLEEKKD